MEINKKKCVQCGLCVKVCVRKNIDEKEYSFGNDCFFCYHCMAVCPKGAISDDGKISPEMKPFSIKPENFENLIYNKRSCRNYTKKEISKRDIEKIASFFKYSPTGTNSQKLQITVLATRKRVKEIADMAMKLFKTINTFALILFPFIVIAAGYKKAKMLTHLGGFIERYFSGEDILTYNAPALFIFHSSKAASTPEQDGVIAGTIGTLYTETLGFASCFNGFLVRAINTSGKMKKHLGIPKRNKVYSVFTLGYPQYKYSRRVLRDNMKMKIIV
jgi:hypothetical protein